MTYIPAMHADQTINTNKYEWCFCVQSINNSKPLTIIKISLSSFSKYAPRIILFVNCGIEPDRPYTAINRLGWDYKSKFVDETADFLNLWTKLTQKFEQLNIYFNSIWFENECVGLIFILTGSLLFPKNIKICINI